MKKIILMLSFMVIFQLNAFAVTLDLKGFEQINDKHFKILFKSGQTDTVPRKILNKAEEYYHTIAREIGYARYQNFWTWDDRVPIVYYSSKEEYIQATGSPSWSKGFSVSHLTSVNQRMIVTYQGQEDFLDSVLPHEIGHLILHDFIGPNRFIPSWFDEGVAQMEERQDQPQEHKALLAGVIQSGHGLPLLLMQDTRALAQQDLRTASIFYAESLYIVKFLVKTYGKESFIKLCRNLRDGKNFEEALKSAYYPAIDSLESLQEKWIQYMMQ